MSQKNNNAVKNTVVGGILIGIGVLFIAEKFFYKLSIARLWPLFMLIPVAIMIIVWFNDKKKYLGIWFPVTLLVFYTVYFLWLNFTSWANVATTWPNFLIAPGAAFLVIYILTREWGHLIPALILLVLAGIFYSEIFDNSLVLAIGLMGSGVLLISGSLLLKIKAARSSSEEEEEGGTG